MSNGVSASRESVRSVVTLVAPAIEPLANLESGPAIGRAGKPHAHHCLTCGVSFACRGPEEIGSCEPICQPCYWIELGSQLRVYREVVSELQRKRLGIERRIGKAVCHRAAARRRKVKTDASLLVAFGKVLNTQPATEFAALRSEAHGGGPHD
jgi:hypothetical protein